MVPPILSLLNPFLVPNLVVSPLHIFTPHLVVAIEAHLQASPKPPSYTTSTILSLDLFPVRGMLPQMPLKHLQSFQIWPLGKDQPVRGYICLSLRGRLDML